MYSHQYNNTKYINPGGVF